MKLFDLSFPNADICNTTDLYYRAAAPFADCLALPQGERATFDTYFNAFSCGKYLQHTVVEKVELALDVEGAVAVELYHVDGEVKESYCWADGLMIKRGTTPLIPEEAPAGTLRETALCRTEDSASHRRTISVTLDITPYKTGYIYFAVTAQSDAKIFGGCYNAPDCTPQNVKVGIVICTYKREDCVKRNVGVIAQYLQQNPDLRDKLSIFVVDNGHTLNAEDIPQATVFPNKNFGGSAGFSRGMLEVCARKEFTHVLLSDDDVVYQPSMFRKTISLLQTAKHPSELAVGSSMLRLDRQNVQHELGAFWNKKFTSVVSAHGEFDISKRTTLLRNEDNEKINYCGWWYLCMPTEKIREKGYALPLFIKYDDVEHCVRTDCEFALLNGIGLWHESFDNKYSAYLEYYIIRNLLISDCLTKKSGGRKMFNWIVMHVSLQLVYQRYFTFPFIFSACNDFLKGADFLLNLDAEALNKKLIAANPKMFTKQQLEKEGYVLDEFYLPSNKKTVGEVLSLNGYLIPCCFYKKQNQKYRVANLQQCYPQQFYKVKRVVQYNPVTQTGFVTKQKFGKLFVAGFKLIGLAFKMLFCYRRAAKSYRKNYSKLTSEETWKKLLDLEQPNPAQRSTK